YDLTHILQSQWKTLGPHLVGKIHVAVGTMDTWYLNLAVKRLQKFLDHTNNPYFAGSFDYGPGQPHCYTGKPNLPARVGALSATERVLKAAAARMLDTAPVGADMSWRY
ncbi:MAG: esterase, partial [Acidobacteriota bacterium]|nr:esterase [Acidobacteriota bacterium]